MFNIDNVKGKKISFKEGVIFTKIARKVKIRQFKQEIMLLINQIRANKNNYSDEEKLELKRINNMKNIKEKNKALSNFEAKIFEKAGIEIGLDIALYVIEMLSDAEEEVIELISTYTKQNENLIADADLEDIIKVLKIMWENGLYKVFTTFMAKAKNLNDEDDLKKTK